MSVFLVGASQAPWGDYGRILVHGMSAHLPRAGGEIQLERAGPFMPPITFPGIGDVIVPERTRQDMLGAGLRGVSFQPVQKARIVRLDWQDWDLTASRAAEVPASGEPEDYILQRPHDLATANAMGDLWELIAPIHGTGKRETVSRIPRRYRTTITLPPTPTDDFFRVEGLRRLFVSTQARRWLEEHLARWVSFESVELV